MDRRRFGQWKALEKRSEPLPRLARFKRAPSKPLEPHVHHTVQEGRKGLAVASNAVVPKVALQFPSKDPMLYRDWLVPLAAQPLIHRLQCSGKSRFRRPSFDHQAALPGLTPEVAKS